MHAAVPHRAAHDLESLFFVLLFICTHLDGPHNSIAYPPLLGKSEHPSPMQQWFAMSNRRDLRYLKFGSMMGHFEEGVLKFISPYFNPLKPHLLSWWRALHPNTGVPADAAQTHFSACRDPIPSNIINVFKRALMDPLLIQETKKSTLKRSFPGELTQDVVPATNTPHPELGPSVSNKWVARKRKK